MPPPKKRVSRLRAIAAERWKEQTTHQSSTIDSNVVPVESSSESENEMYLLDSDEEIIENDAAVEKANLIVLQWKEGAKPKRQAAYLKDSERTKRRQKKAKAQRMASVADCNPISSYFPPANSASDSINLDEVHVNDSSHPVGNIDSTSAITLNQALEKVGSLAAVSVNRSHENRQSKMTKYDFIRYTCFLRYFSLLKSGQRAMESSLEVAKLFPNRSINYTARKNRNGLSFTSSIRLFLATLKANTSRRSH
jgi:hypothetical protein